MPGWGHNLRRGGAHAHDERKGDCGSRPKIRSQSATRIEEERQWRSRPLAPQRIRQLQSSCHAMAWLRHRGRQVCSETPTDCYIIGISLRSMNVRVSISGRSALTGVAMPGTLLVPRRAWPLTVSSEDHSTRFICMSRQISSTSGTTRFPGPRACVPRSLRLLMLRSSDLDNLF